MQEEMSDSVRKVVDNVDVMLGYWDRDQRCRFANAAYKTWFGKSPRELLGRPLKELLGPIYELNLPHIRAALDGHIQVFERTIPLPDGTVRHSLASYYPDVVDGVVRGFTVQVTDVTRLKQLEFELQEAKKRAEVLATHDFLTGLPNRLLLVDRIETAMIRVRRSQGSFALTAIDMDGFKTINDTYGHDAGDAVLKVIAARMKAVIRATDTITRLGGDEFIFLANDVDSMEGLVQAIRRLLGAVCQPLQLPSLDLTPSLSCGIALFPTNGTSESELMAKADAALYQAKRQGKNRFVFAE